MRFPGILCLFLALLIITGQSFAQDRSRTDLNDRIRLRQDSITLLEDTITFREELITYRIDTITFREELIRHLADSVYYRFGEYINGVYVIRLQNLEYINARIIIDNSPPLNISRIVGNVAIGGVVIVTSVLLPPLAPALPPLMATIVKSINTAQVVHASLVAAALGASISGVQTYIQSGGDPRQTFYRAIEGAADGFAWGAVLSYGTRAADVAIRFRNTETLVRNLHLAGAVHPQSGVPFVGRIIEYGRRFYRGAFPVFQSRFDATLPSNLFRASDARHFAESNRQLWRAIQSNNQLRQSFTPEQLQQIREGIRTGTAPSGFKWHHSEIPGRMQLVDSQVHSLTGHAGGRYIWGGGRGFR